MPSLPSSINWTATGLTREQVRQATEQARQYLSSLLGDDGTIATALSKLGAVVSGVVSLSAATTVTATHRGKLLSCSGTWTLSLTAAATLGAGFACAVRNTGSGTITIDPSGTETVDGATTLALSPGDSCLLVCTGSAWVTVGLVGLVTTSRIANGAVTAAKLATGTSERDWVLARIAASSAGAVGTFLFGGSTAASGGTITFGGTVAGSTLIPDDGDGNLSNPYGLSGTWMCLGRARFADTRYTTTLWLRIA